MSDPPFGELQRLQRELAALREYHVASLRQFHLEDDPGFRRLLEETDSEFSRTSTATCLLSLIGAGKWGVAPWKETGDDVVRMLLDQKRWGSSGLPNKNPYAVAFMLEAAMALRGEASGAWGSNKSTKSLGDGIEILIQTLEDNQAPAVYGTANIEHYPPSSYVTQLVCRVIQKSGTDLSGDLTSAIRTWAKQQFEREIALFAAESPNADAYSLVYSLMLFVSFGVARLTPEENLLVRRGIDLVFRAQREDGTWPLSRPIFHHKDVGNAYCYEYEMLTQLLANRDLTEYLLPYIPKLAVSAYRLRESAYKLEGDTPCWTSGHHPQHPGPESWATASVFHFLHLLDRLLAEDIRRTTFEYVGAEYLPPTKPKDNAKEFAPALLDSTFRFRDREMALRSLVFDCVVAPVASAAEAIEHGLPIDPKPRVSAILFGPPGTYKTELAGDIAKYLGWPLLEIDPSHLVRRGFDQVQAEANEIFSMIAASERVVVLLDEFDEMVRERKTSEMVSRFLTTAMLPKLARINSGRRIVFLLATNHVEEFDKAILRPGRFDLIVPVMTPSLQAKRSRWPEFFELLRENGVSMSKAMRSKLTSLTFHEFDALASHLVQQEDPDAIDMIDETHKESSLAQPSSQSKKDPTSLYDHYTGLIDKYARIPSNC